MAVRFESEEQTRRHTIPVESPEKGKRTYLFDLLAISAAIVAVGYVVMRLIGFSHPVAMLFIGGWIVLTVLVLLFNFGAHRNDPPDMKG